jgi:carboxymethylenebutenolidase
MRGITGRQALAGLLTAATIGCGRAALSGVEMAPAPSAETALAHLESSPRHGEWVSIPVPSGDTVRAWVVYPERADNAPVVLVVHEIFGLTHWIRSVADQLAAEGFIAVAPDLLTGGEVPSDPTGEPDRNTATRVIQTLDRDQVHRRIWAAGLWARALAASTERYAIMGFCWGGTVAFEHAARDADLATAVVYYGSSPPPDRLLTVEAPVLGLYGGNDARVNATIPAADSVLASTGRTFQTRMYDAAGHGFLRQQNEPGSPNQVAARAAWTETITWLRRHLQ